MGNFQDDMRTRTVETVQASTSGTDRRAAAVRHRAVRRWRAWLSAALAALGTLTGPLSSSMLVAEPPVVRSQLRTGPQLQVRLRENMDPAPAPTDAQAPLKSLRATLASEPSPPSPAAANNMSPAELRDDDVPSELPSEVFPAQFQNVVPSETTKDQLLEQLGRPTQELTGEQSVIWAYPIGPFPRVEFRLVDDVVQSIRVQLAEPMSRKQVAADLDLGDFETTPVADDRGEVRGEIVPERGLQLGWSRDSEPPEITQILLEAPRAAHFLRRAQQDPWQRYQRMLSDLSVAKRLEPQSAAGLALEARIRQRLGQPLAALELATSAVLLDEPSADYRLLRASLLGDNGRHAEALQLADQVLADKRMTPEFLAYARCVRGELLLASPTGRPEQALHDFQLAIAAAGKLTETGSATTQRMAREVLLVAYLGGATAIAQGKWQNRTATVEKWWNSARAISHESDDGAQAESLERWNVLRRHLQLASLAGGRIPAQEIDGLREDARRWSDRAADPLLTSRLDWDLAESLLHAAELAQANQLWPEAREYAEEGLERAKSAAASREPGFATDYLQGRLDFLQGAYHATVSKDAEQVKLWLDQASQRFASQHPLPAVEQFRHGERLVFMGQTYAEQEDQENAARWLARGIDLLEPLAQQGAVPAQRVLGPLKQLAAIHQSQGKSKTAAELTARAEKLKKKPQ